MTTFGVEGATSLVDGNFHMLSFVVDNAAKELRVYADGLLLKQQAISNWTTISTTQPLALCWTNPHPLLGAIDELMLFDHALSLTEIQAVKTAVTP